ncbi:MAG: PilZ domain-containing protein [Proteobacteria bacterium]|nr:PilZ domain-containing protein [Pseudomonadota bacterium]MBU1710505.1 PilZ domain-containing protein [Pseudomonadota bacterium]
MNPEPAIAANIERRWHKRFKAKGHAFAVITTPDSVELCHIIDISSTGLSFRYFADSPELNDEFQKISILFSENFYLEGVPAQSVSDRKIDTKLPHIIKMRRRGIKFGDLDKEQISQIQYFIRHNTAGIC